VVNGNQTIDPMSEFKFSCPQCKQSIQCDSTNTGSRINCPVCQRAIVIPRAPSPAGEPGERTFQVKASTLRTVAAIGVGVLLSAGIILLTAHLVAGPKTLRFKAYVDGVDVIKLSGKKFWIEHQADQLPARMMIDGKKWNPAWSGNTSMPYDLNPTFHPGHPESIQLMKLAGRGPVSIEETPTTVNDETLSIRVDDGGIGGADWYEFSISW